MIDALIRIFSETVDLQRVAQPGDGFVVVTDRRSKRSRARGAGIVLAALTHGGQTDRLYRFTTRRGAVGYFDENGRSAGKLLVRRPLRGGLLRSSFGLKQHPILGYAKMHTGVDWAASTGTPVYAAGPAMIEAAGWEGGKAIL